MEDERILDLYFERNEEALAQSEKKYGGYCLTIAGNLLSCREDALECVNDTWLGAWNAIPPDRPLVLRTFLGKITRRISLKRVRSLRAQKRGGGEADLVLSELSLCDPSADTVEDAVLLSELTEILNDFLSGLPEAERRIFLRRYWYFDPVKEIAKHCGFSESRVKMSLKRSRDKLIIRLKKEGYSHE